MTKTVFDWDKLSIDKDEPGFEHLERSGERLVSYIQALRETFDQILRSNDRTFIMGQGVDDPFGMFGTTLDLHKKFGRDRVFDTPLAEEGMMGVAAGAALAGMRPIYMHNRPDFLLVAMNQLVNHASKWSYMFGGKINVPLVIWACVGRGWGSGAQHSQSLHGLFMHVPGLKLVMPSNPYDSKGLLTSAVLDPNPVLIIEHRWALKHKGYVPENLYTIPFGKGVVKKEGTDVTVVAVSYMVIEALRAHENLLKDKISIEVIDPRTLKPLDEDIIVSSVKKTGRLIIADPDWKTTGASAEIAAIVSEKCASSLKAPVIRVCMPDVPTPSCHSLENAFYPSEKDITKAVKEILK